MKKLKIAPEYKCSPIWISKNDNSTSESVSPTDLSISEDLIRLIENWDLLYQGTYNEDYPPDSGFLLIEEYNKYLELAAAVYKKITEEIGNEYIITSTEIVKETNESINFRIIKLLKSCLDINTYKEIMYFTENEEYKIFSIMKPKDTYLGLSKKLLCYTYNDLVEYLQINEIEIEDNLDKGSGKIIRVRENRIIDSINSREKFT